MGTHKICVAVNKRSPHWNTLCGRTWAAVCGHFTATKCARHGHLGGAEGQFGGSIFVQQDKAG